jgi:hypothetical protein
LEKCLGEDGLQREAFGELVHNQATFFGMMRCSAHSQS